MTKLNTTDRKIINTGGSDSDSGQQFRTTEVRVVGAEYESPTDQPDSSTDSPAESGPDIGTVRNVVVEEQDVRIQPDGAAVIDVTLSFEQAENAVRHELRLSKV